ncbi:MAG: DMT family transporter [Pseudomonadales bacterium]|nr:DMT family transporter [Pseudomonadales bacterium]
MPKRSGAKKTAHRSTIRKNKTKKPAHSRWYYYSFLILNAIIWGAAFIAIKPSFEYTTPFRFLFYRFTLASMFGLPVILWYVPKIKEFWKKVGIITISEILGIPIALGMLYTGLERTTAIEAGFLTTTVPIFVVLFGIWFLKEREERREWEGLALAFLGTIILTLTPLFEGEAMLDHVSLSGNLLIFMHNILIGIYYILVKKHYHTLPKVFAAAVSFVVGAISFFFMSLGELHFSLPALVEAVRFDIMQPSVQLAALYMGILGSVIALTAYIIGQDGVEASEATLFSYLQPLVYVPLGIIILGERVNWEHGIALVLIFVGVVLGEWKGKRRQRKS